MDYHARKYTGLRRSETVSGRPLYQISFAARNVTTLASVGGNTLNIIALSNTNYKYSRHPDWAGSTPTLPRLSLSIFSRCRRADARHWA